MTRNWHAVAACVLTALTLEACGSSFAVHEISHRPLESTAAVDGIPFRMEDAYRLRVFKRKDDGTYEEVHVQDQVMPDPDRLYAIGFKAKRFADNTLKLELREDGTLQAINFTSTKKLDEAIAEFGKQGGAVAEAFLTQEDVARAKELERLETTNKIAKEQQTLADSRDPETELQDREAALEAALQALMAAENAQAVLDNLDDPSEVDRIAAEGALRLAQLHANQAYRRAGLPPPYPGVFP